jgi:phosphotransferase family enzyme
VSGAAPTSGELRAALEGVLGQRIVVLERRPSMMRSSLTLEEIDVTLADGTSLPLMFKDAGYAALPEGGRSGWAKPAFLHDPLREIATYRTILADARLGTATLYGSAADTEAGRYWLFLERVAGVELNQVGLAAWQQAARWLASLHTHFAPPHGTLPAGEAARHLLRYDAAFYHRWLDRACAIVDRADPPLPAEARRDLERLAARYDTVVAHLTALPPTFIHGDCYAMNVLVQEREGPLRVCPVDWEMAALGPGLIDMAALSAGDWSEVERAALLAAYVEGLRHEGFAAGSDLAASLAHCRLHLAMQCLGWSERWPPRPHSLAGWLAEVVGLARKVGL